MSNSDSMTAGCGCGGGSGGCTCGCCTGVTDLTPVDTTNPPGLPAIAYRVGTHSTFKTTMLSRLASADAPALAGLRTRDDDDLSIALLDAWATVGDVLTFYQERIANESYLRTATERLSLLQLARLIGYELSPGVAASTVLSFTIENTPGAAQLATIAAGTKVQSIPGPGQLPQTFETTTALDARAEWNTIGARSTAPQLLSTTMPQVVLAGITNNVKAGDTLLIAVAGDTAARRIGSVAVDRVQQLTTVVFEEDVASSPSAAKEVPPVEAHPLATGAATEGARDAFESLVSGTGVSQRAIEVSVLENGLLGREVEAALATARFFTQPPGDGVFAFRARASVFGHNAPSNAFLKSVNPNVVATDPDASTVVADASAPTEIALDGIFTSIVNDSWVVLSTFSSGTTTTRIYSVASHSDESRADFAISGKVTALVLDRAQDLGLFPLRGTSVLAQSEALVVADLPITDPVEGDSITLDGGYLELGPGRLIVVSGTPVNPGDPTTESAAIASAVLNGGYTTINLQQALEGTYVPSSVVINANAALATNGETVNETLGNGDASQPYQEFALRQSPLTYVSAATASGRASTLALRVNGIQWHEAPTLYGAGPRDRVFITRRADDGTTTIESGDGVTGARFPSGVENLAVTYRKGIGSAGLVDAGQLSLLMTRQVGVKSVTNTEAATGAEDPEVLDDARQNAPVTVMTLDRVVSLEDYENFARAFAGVAKALATWTWTGQARSIFLTVAGVAGAPVPADSSVGTDLVAALRAAGDPYVLFRVATYQPAFFQLAARVKVDPDYIAQDVLDAVSLALTNAFSFSARDFGQSVALSEVEATMQSVPGVIAVVVDTFTLYGGPAGVAQRLVAAVPAPGADAGSITAAELLTLDPGGPDLQVFL